MPAKRLATSFRMLSLRTLSPSFPRLGPDPSARYAGNTKWHPRPYSLADANAATGGHTGLKGFRPGAEKRWRGPRVRPRRRAGSLKLLEAVSRTSAVRSPPHERA